MSASLANNEFPEGSLQKFEQCTAIRIRIGNTEDVSHSCYKIL